MTWSFAVPDNVVTFILRTTDIATTTIAYLWKAHACLKCMKDGGVGSQRIWKLVADNKLDICVRLDGIQSFSLVALDQALWNRV